MPNCPRGPYGQLIAGLLLMFIGVGTMISVKQEAHHNRPYWIRNGMSLLSGFCLSKLVYLNDNVWRYNSSIGSDFSIV